MGSIKPKKELFVFSRQILSKRPAKKKLPFASIQASSCPPPKPTLTSPMKSSGDAKENVDVELIKLDDEVFIDDQVPRYLDYRVKVLVAQKDLGSLVVCSLSMQVGWV